MSLSISFVTQLDLDEAENRQIAGNIVCVEVVLSSFVLNLKVLCG